MAKCPRCGLEVATLQHVTPEMIEGIRGAGLPAPPPEVCENCYMDLERTSGSSAVPGGAIMAAEKAKEQYRLQLWKSRVQLIKRGRTMMLAKDYSEAAVAYEKYIKILELVFGCKKGERLTPAMFKDSARTSEMTVLVSVYWDLLRIYDTSDKYGDRQEVAARQLAAFLHFTPIFPDIIKKAESFARSARNPAKIKLFLKASAKQRPRCFVATSAFNSPMATEVQILRFWRDQTLRNGALGRWFIVNYYRYSPPIARFLDKHPWLKPCTRAVLRIFTKCIG